MTYKNFSSTSPGRQQTEQRADPLLRLRPAYIYAYTLSIKSCTVQKNRTPHIHFSSSDRLLSVSMEKEDLLVIMCVTLIAACWFHLLLKWSSGHRRRRRCELTLPPGSMGLPLLGESLEFFARIPSLEVLPFFKRRLERYGNGIVNLISWVPNV